MEGVLSVRHLESTKGNVDLSEIPGINTGYNRAKMLQIVLCDMEYKGHLTIDKSVTYISVVTIA